jgi:hypothetical protein
MDPILENCYLLAVTVTDLITRTSEAISKALQKLKKRRFHMKYFLIMDILIAPRFE